MIVKAKLKCDHCNHKTEYTSDMVEYGQIKCKKCGKSFKIDVWVDAVNVDYLNTNGTVRRRDPKKKMRKKDRRREREQNLLD